MRPHAPLLLAIMTTAVLATPATARVCRDAHGRIVKCLPVVTSPPPGCRDTHGHLIPCPVDPGVRAGKHKVAPPAHR